MDIQAADLVAGEVLDEAFRWLCRARRAWPASADVWSFRRAWDAERERLRAEIVEGRYRFGPLRRVTIEGGEEIDLWPARDALVLKCLALVLGQRLPLSRRCCHLKGHGGAKGAVRAVLAALPANRFVLKTDVYHYYDSIDHHVLLDRLRAAVGDRLVVNLVAQYLWRTSERGGLFRDYRRGIPLGAPLSPVLGAFFLAELDRALERHRLFFLRFMDDVVVLAPSRARLRRAVKALNQVLDALGLEKHPEKTFVGTIEKGFDFLGYHLTPTGLGVAACGSDVSSKDVVLLVLWSRRSAGGQARRRSESLHLRSMCCHGEPNHGRERRHPPPADAAYRPTSHVGPANSRPAATRRGRLARWGTT